MINLRKVLLATALLSAGSLAVIPLAEATPISPSPTITTGAITFNNFTCAVTGGLGLSCDAISVTSYVSTTPPDAKPGEDGIRIQGAFNGFPGSEDVAITYNATVAGGVFSDAELYFNGSAVSNVHEEIYNADNGHLIGTLDVVNPPPTLTDWTLLSEPATSIYVVKDIGLLYGGDFRGTISLIDQNYSVNVPEPATLALFAVGLLGCAVGLRRRRSSEG